MRCSLWFRGLAALCFGLAFSLCLAPPLFAQDFRVLEERTPPNPLANEPIPLLPAAATHVRVLIAGDSWAQYMWDDGSHNDIFDRFGHADKRALSLSLGSDPGPGYTGPEYAISGSEARQWVDTANYPWIANTVAALEANPEIELVVLSVDGNDVLAGRPDGGWYKDMDLDAPGSEAAFFSRLQDDTETILDAILAVRPDIRIILSSYDYPNFNVGFWCFLYACPKRRDLSRDPVNDLITDTELNDMMVRVETQRIGWVNANPRLRFDHAVGLMHYFYGDGVATPRTLPYPGQLPPLFAPFPGGNPLRPSLRSCFRIPNGIDADPIHLDVEGYQYKITNETQTHFFPEFRGAPMATFFARGGTEDGWTDGTTTGTDGVRAGDNGTAVAHGIVTFDTSSLPDGAEITSASVYLIRNSLTGTNPFTSGALGVPRVDVARGSFGAADVEAGDATATADAVDAAYVIGSAKANEYAVRLELTGAGLAAINDQGLTQFRISFPHTGSSTGGDYVIFRDGDAVSPPTSGMPALAQTIGTSRPFLDVTFNEPTAVAEAGEFAEVPRLRQASPNPFTASTRIVFSLPRAGRARVEVYDVTGRLVRRLFDGDAASGATGVTWDGRDDRGARLSGGIYYARLATAERTSALKVVMLGR
jgi:hypothetical protein